MDKDYLLIGTAGHIDHGKSLLIQALTGINTDRLKEEQRRGISIELGFAYFTLPGGKKVGIVDVPGHERFIRQMLAGASGMDVVLLVIAADEGVMPQTREHLDILGILEIDKGIVVITKTDLVDEEWLALIEEDIQEKLKGSIFEHAPVCKVSSVTGDGIPELARTIINVLANAGSKRTDLPARMPIDRVFTVQGFGTVVTGTLNSGLLQKGQDIAVEPGGYTAKIRNIQVHGDSVPQAAAGQRVALNLGGLAVREIRRGLNAVAPGFYHTGRILDVMLRNIPEEQRTIKHRQRLHFYLGTAECLGRIHLLDREELRPGEDCYAQIILEEAVLAAFGDRFVIRYYSPVTTIGGGKVLGIVPCKRKRFRENVMTELSLKAKGNSKDLIRKELENPVQPKEIAAKTGIAQAQIEQVLVEMIRGGEVLEIFEEKNTIYWLKAVAEKWGGRVSAAVARFQQEYPLSGGIGREELKNRLRMDIAPKHWQLLLAWGARQHYFNIAGSQLEPRQEIKLPEIIQNQLECLQMLWAKAGLNPPDAKEGAASCGIREEKFEEFAAFLTRKGLWTKIGDFYIATESLQKAKALLKKLLEVQGEITVAEARDLWQTSRRYALPLLEYFDSIRFTKREQSLRRLWID
jgi:selenocysteine-specific elongation factor